MKVSYDFALERKQFSRSIKQFDMIKNKFARMIVRTWESDTVNYATTGSIDSSIEKYDHKRGFCTLTAEVKIPVEDLIMESPFVGSWTVSVPTENGTITLN